MNDYLQIRELYHHGIKGQKWGIRRWQNEDGTLTELGKQKYGKNNVNELTKEQLIDLNTTVKLENSIDRETAAAYKKANVSDVLYDTSKITNQIANAIPRGKGKYINDKDYSNMSDQELRSRINRLQLEEQYGRLSGDTKYVESGREKTREILQTIGAVLAVGATAAGVAVTIKNMIPAKKAGD